MPTDTIYKKLILENFKKPRNVGQIPNPDALSKKVNLSCGDRIEVFLKINNGVISDLKYRIDGCAISVASISILSDQIIGKKIEEVLKISKEGVMKNIGLEDGSGREKCATIGFEALIEALNDYIQDH